MRKYLIASVILFVCSFAAVAQYNSPRNKIWRFGMSAGLDFNSGGPVVAPAATAYNFHRSTQVCNGAGEMLFYTDGRVVYNRTGAIMAHGDSIIASNNGALALAPTIVPVAGNPDRYYIFTMGESGFPGSWHGRLTYSIVDMTLDGGLGAVLPSHTNILVDSEFHNQIVTVPRDECTMWLVCHKRAGLQFYAFPVTGTGVGPAIVSTTGTCTYCYSGGGMKASPDGTRITTQNYRNLELHDFDPITGVVSNTRLIDTFSGGLSQEYSPDGTKLYVNHNDPTIPISPGVATGFLTQLDISLPTTAAILASHTVLATDLDNSFSLKLGPDGKIYLTDRDHYFLNSIANPNAAGAACGYTLHAIDLHPQQVVLELPTLYRDLPPGTVPCATEATNLRTTDNISVSPNPGNGIFKLNIPSALEMRSVIARIYSVTGTKIYDDAVPASDMLDISAYSAGIYLLMVTAGNTHAVIKLQKD